MIFGADMSAEKRPRTLAGVLGLDAALQKKSLGCHVQESVWSTGTILCYSTMTVAIFQL